LEKRYIIGNACLRLYPYIKSIYLNLGRITGKLRQPEKIEFLVGIDDPIVIHKEHDVMYKFDITKIMFSKGNLRERRFLSSLVKPGEVVVDMFAGIGYFSLPIGKHSDVRKIYSIELNPLSYRFLEENVRLNHLEPLIEPIQGNCKEEVEKLSVSGVKADRVIMGIFPAPVDYVKSALTLVKEKGTIFHYEGVTDKEKYIDLYKLFDETAIKYNYSASLISKRFVKSYGPNLYHVVLDILVKRIRECSD
ncbi:MAG: class I SAM-dependent methyltransferase family protein, partial [Promethearchaeota archaeon]